MELTFATLARSSSQIAARELDASIRLYLLGHRQCPGGGLCDKLQSPSTPIRLGQPEAQCSLQEHLTMWLPTAQTPALDEETSWSSRIDMIPHNLNRAGPSTSESTSPSKHLH
jgi:hypothetical protein